MFTLKKRAKEPDAQPQEVPVQTAMSTVTTVEVVTSKGIQPVTIGKFSALDGWSVARQTKEFATTTDSDVRLRFTLYVLSLASVEGTRLDSEEAINATLEKWENVETVFNATLEWNGIDSAALDAMKLGHWSVIGMDLGAAFMAAMEKLMEPALQSIEKGSKQ